MTRTERTYYVVFAAYNTPMLIAASYPLFLLSRGLDLLQIHLVLATFLIGSFLFDVPTGAFADLFGRKVSFLLSCVIRTTAFVMYAFAGGFRDCLVAEMVDALGLTLANGALDAWAIDGMHAEGRSGPMEGFFARAQVISRSVMIAVGIAGGYIAQYSFRLAWLVAATGYVITAILALLLMREAPRPAMAIGDRVYRSVGRTIRAALVTVRDVPMLRMLCLLTLATAFATMPSHMLWQPRMQQLTGEGAWLMGWIWAAINLAVIAGSWLVPWVQRRWSREHLLCGASIWRGAMFVVIGLATSFVPALAGMLFAEIGFALSEPQFQAWMNEHIPPDRRATLLSVRSMSFTLGGACGLACAGFIARDVGIGPAWLLPAAIFILTAPGFLLLGRVARRTDAALLASSRVSAEVVAALQQTETRRTRKNTIDRAESIR